MNDKHPFQIAITENKAMGAFDLGLFVGNFKSRAEAQEYADKLAEIMRASGWALAVQ